MNVLRELHEHAKSSFFDLWIGECHGCGRLRLHLTPDGASGTRESMDLLVKNFCKFLLFLSGVSMVATVGVILLGVASRQFLWDIPGLDAYAGYAIAATLFLALPA